MKPASKEKTPSETKEHKPFLTWLKETREIEMEDPGFAEGEYKKMIRAYPLKEEAYDRLMIIYRRAKNYEGEIGVIKKAVKAFEDKFGKASQQQPKGKKLVSLSKSLLKSVGLADKKGKPLYEHQPIARWNKRKQLVEARLKNFSKS